MGQRRGVEDAAARLTPAGSGPVVNLPADEYYAPVGHTVRLDAGASYSAGSKIVRWDWDIDSDGVYETHDGAAVMEHSYSAQGDYTVKVRATDSNGAVTERQVTVHAGTTTGIPTLAGGCGHSERGTQRHRGDPALECRESTRTWLADHRKRVPRWGVHFQYR